MSTDAPPPSADCHSTQALWRRRFGGRGSEGSLQGRLGESFNRFSTEIGHRGCGGAGGFGGGRRGGRAGFGRGGAGAVFRRNQPSRFCREPRPLIYPSGSPSISVGSATQPIATLPYFISQIGTSQILRVAAPCRLLRPSVVSEVSYLAALAVAARPVLRPSPRSRHDQSNQITGGPWADGSGGASEFPM